MQKRHLSATIFIIGCLLAGCSHAEQNATAGPSAAGSTADTAAQDAYANSLLDRMQAMPAPARRSFAKRTSPEVEYLRMVKDPQIKARFDQLSQ
jgi:hypothetical protein